MQFIDLYEEESGIRLSLKKKHLKYLLETEPRLHRWFENKMALLVGIRQGCGFVRNIRPALGSNTG